MRILDKIINILLIIGLIYIIICISSEIYKNIAITNEITLEELQAINKQISELGWNNESKGE